MAVSAFLLKRGDVILLGEKRLKVTLVQELLPKCLAETYVEFEDGSSERFCNAKQITVIKEK